MAIEIEKEQMEGFSDWLQHPPNGQRPKGAVTITTYLYVSSRFQKFLEGAELNEEAARGFLRHLEEIGNSPRTRAQAFYALQSYFAFRGVDFGMGPPDLTEEPPPRWLTDEEWSRLLEEAEKPLGDPALPQRAKTRALFPRAVLMVYGGAGLLLSEGCALRKEGVDHRGYLRILQKGGEERIVPVDDAVVIAILEWMKTHDSPWVFPGKGEGHMHRRTAQAAILSLMKKAKIKNVSHAVGTLRNTVGMNLSMRSPHPQGSRVYGKTVDSDIDLVVLMS
ncbi:hypothetical protein LCGC14_3090680, partial [marine sediment metagenome]